MRISQIINNILTNAVKYTERGFIRFSATYSEIPAGKIELIVSVEDSGKGIKKENLDKIFIAGFTTKSAGVGTGLGLAISQKIIDKHHGKIHVDSEFGHGSCFTISIPIVNKT